MKSLNKRKILYVGALLSACSITFMTFQNFTERRLASVGLEAKPRDTSRDSISAALQAAEMDRESKQMVLNDEEVRLKKLAEEKKNRKPDAVIIESEPELDSSSNTLEPSESTF